MEVRKIIFDESTFGITQRSLKMLRDTLSRGIDQHIAVFECPTNDLCCGYLILNRDTQTATFTGDGFRLDRGGEGGAGYISAEALLGMYGLKALYWKPINIDEIYQGDTESVRQKLLKLAQELAETFYPEDFTRSSEKKPEYIRGRI